MQVFFAVCFNISFLYFANDENDHICFGGVGKAQAFPGLPFYVIFCFFVVLISDLSIGKML